LENFFNEIFAVINSSGLTFASGVELQSDEPPKLGSYASIVPGTKGLGCSSPLGEEGKSLAQNLQFPWNSL